MLIQFDSTVVEKADCWHQVQNRCVYGRCKVVAESPVASSVVPA